MYNVWWGPELSDKRIGMKNIMQSLSAHAFKKKIKGRRKKTFVNITGTSAVDETAPTYLSTTSASGVTVREVVFVEP